MGPGGPVSINLIAVGYALDNCYEEVDDKEYFIHRLKALVSSKIHQMIESSKDGKTRS